ncbi:MAG: hypothetical protein J0L51_03780 [Rhizobiales bacterium]|nr:hypothetical protein [Hyphomicrobiales bacterium]
MINVRTSTKYLFAALALGGAAITAASEASAWPGRGPRHGFDWHPAPHHIWRGHYGPRFVHYGGGYRCRMIRRVNAYGELVVRRVCFNRYY